MTSLHALLLAPFETLAFMRAALVACAALALANGAVGTLLVLRRMSLDGDVLGHAVMPGAAVGFLYAGPSATWLSIGGLASGLAVALLAGVVARDRARHDAGLVAFYLVALSLGVLLVAWRGSNVDVMRVLFGTILSIDQRALLSISAVCSVIVLVIAALYRPLAIGAFDPALLRAAGGRVPYGVIFVVLVVLAVGRELPGVRHLARRWTDAAAGSGGALLEPWRRRIDGAGDRAWPDCLHRGTAAVVSCQSAVRSGDCTGRRCAVLCLAWCHRRVAPPDPSLGRRRMRARLLALLLLALPAHAAPAPTVVATFSIIADMLAAIGGDHIVIRTMVGPGGDCELYQPTAADVATVATARAVFLNDLDEEFEPWLQPLLKQAGFRGESIVVTRGVRTLLAEEEHPVSGHQLPSAIDQHAWMDPRNGVIYARNIAAALARLDPANAADYRTRAMAYEQQIKARG